jgi:hypothetical protein
VHGNPLIGCIGLKWRQMMKEYKVVEHPIGKIEPVKQGWSWPAFFFNWVWALIKRMWGIAVTFFLISLFMEIIIDGAEFGIGMIVMFIVSIVIVFIFGMNGNDWREKNLLSRGFDFRMTVEALNQDHAVSTYLKEK